MLNLVHENDYCKLYHGDSTEYTGDADWVITNPYANLPKQLQSKPMLICDFDNRHKLAEERCGTKLELVSHWYNGINSIWVGNHDLIKVDLTDLNPEMPEGWFPEELVWRLLRDYKVRGVVWDGFMGRGTVGKASKYVRRFIGIDKDIKRVEYAKFYIFS
jgi:hypothetical protein